MLFLNAIYKSLKGWVVELFFLREYQIQSFNLYNANYYCDSPIFQHFILVLSTKNISKVIRSGLVNLECKLLWRRWLIVSQQWMWWISLMSMICWLENLIFSLKLSKIILSTFFPKEKKLYAAWPFFAFFLVSSAMNDMTKYPHNLLSKIRC